MRDEEAEKACTKKLFEQILLYRGAIAGGSIGDQGNVHYFNGWETS